MVMKTASSNIQAPEKFQISSSNGNVRLSVMIGVWCLMFLWSLELGIWNFPYASLSS
jgi:hypothetical protein